MASIRQISIGGVKIGGGVPVAVQSMTTTRARDVAKTMTQIEALASAGCEIVRCAVPGLPDAEALPEIVRRSPLPVVADIHFNSSLALKAITAGVAAVRINPGNIGGPGKVAEVVQAAKQAGTPLRIGANSGSLPEHLRSLAHEDQAQALVAAAMEEVELLERLDFHDFKISVKSTSVPDTIRAYRMLAEKVPYPLHVGVTEAGTVFGGTIKSAVGIGTLLAEGIGDTIRVSLTPEPGAGRELEVEVAQQVLQSMGLRSFLPQVSACPGCGRTTSTFFQEMARDITDHIRARMPGWRETHPGVEELKVAVMGCVVNGPGESKHADIGISLPGTFEAPVAPVFVDGKLDRTLRGDAIVAEFIDLLERYVDRRYGAVAGPA